MTIKLQSVLEFSLEHVPLVEQLTKPLSDNFAITSFGFRRFLPNGKSLGLSSSASWTAHYHSHWSNKVVPTYDREILLASRDGARTFFRTGSQPQDAFEADLLEKGLWNTLAIYVKNHKHIDGFYFSSNPQDGAMVNFYANNVDLLRLFGVHFAQNLDAFLKNEELYVKTLSPNTYSVAEGPHKTQALENMLKSLKIESLQLQLPEGSVSISLREFQCLFLMSKGQTFKEIGKALDLSPRTIESYINNLKSKTGTNSKSELITLYFNSPYNDLTL